MDIQHNNNSNMNNDQQSVASSVLDPFGLHQPYRNSKNSFSEQQRQQHQQQLSSASTHSIYNPSLSKNYLISSSDQENRLQRNSSAQQEQIISKQQQQLPIRTKQQQTITQFPSSNPESSSFTSIINSIGQNYSNRFQTIPIVNSNGDDDSENGHDDIYQRRRTNDNNLDNNNNTHGKSLGNQKSRLSWFGMNNRTTPTSTITGTTTSIPIDTNKIQESNNTISNGFYSRQSNILRTVTEYLSDDDDNDDNYSSLLNGILDDNQYQLPKNKNMFDNNDGEVEIVFENVQTKQQLDTKAIQQTHQQVKETTTVMEPKQSMFSQPFNTIDNVDEMQYAPAAVGINRRSVVPSINVTYGGSSANSPISLLSTSPIERMRSLHRNHNWEVQRKENVVVTQPIKPQNNGRVPPQIHHTNNFIESKNDGTNRRQDNNSHIRESTDTKGHLSVTQQMTSKIVGQLQSQLEEYQKEVTTLEREKQELASQLTESRQQTSQVEMRLLDLEKTNIIEQDHQASILEMKEKELNTRERDLHQQSEALHRARTDVDRRKTSIEGLEYTVQEYEITYQQEQARLLEWKEELQKQQATNDNERNRLLRQRQDLTTAQTEWDVNRKQQEDEMRKEQRQLIGWEKRLRQHEEQINAQQDRLNNEEMVLRSNSEQMNRDRIELDTKQHDLESTKSVAETDLQTIQKMTDELALQYEEEKVKLEKVIQQRAEEIAYTENEVQEWEESKERLDSEINECAEQLDDLQKKIDLKHKELASAKARINDCLVEEKKKKDTLDKEIIDADHSLTAILDQLQVAQREKSNLDDTIEKKQEYIDSIQKRMEHDEMRLKNEQQRLQQEKSDLDAERTDFLLKTHETFSDAMKRLQNHSDDLNCRQVTAQKSLDKRIAQVESLRETVVALCRNYEEKFRKLKEDQDECNRLKESLKEQIKTSSEARNRDFETQLEYLQQQLESERKRHDHQLDSVIHQLRQEADTQLSEVTDHLESALLERDEYQSELESFRRIVEERDEELTSERESFVLDCDRLQQALDMAVERAQMAEDVVERLDDEKIERMKELHSMKNTMDKLEGQICSLEKDKEEWTCVRARMKDNEASYSQKLQKLVESEQIVSDEHERLEKKRRQLEHGFQQLQRQKQKVALMQLVQRPIRAKREEVSAAFSKWVRVTMFHMDNEEMNAQTINQQNEWLLQERNEVREVVQAIEGERDELVRREQDLQHSLESLQSEYESLSVETKDIIHDLQKEIEQLKLQLNSTSTDAADYSKEILAKVTKAENDLAMKEMELNRKEKLLHDNDILRSKQFEVANERIIRMAQRLSQKEKEIEQKAMQTESKKEYQNNNSNNILFPIDHSSKENKANGGATNFPLFEEMDNSATGSAVSRVIDVSWSSP